MMPRMSDAGPAHAGFTEAAPAEQVLAKMPAGVLVLDSDGRLLTENDRLRDLWGSFIRRRPDDIFPADAHRPGGAPMRPEHWPVWRSLRTGATVADEEIELERPDGDSVSVLASSVPIRNEDAAIVGAVMLVTDITDRRDTDDLREAFVSVLSHELRTPITSIYGGVELLRQRDLPPATRASILDDVALEAESLNRIVEDLLVIVRLQADVEIVRGEPILLQRVLASALADEQRRWPIHHFEMHLPAGLPAIEGDDGLVRQVLRNLLSNAAKYGPHDGTILVKAEATENSVVVRVLDDGPGMPDDVSAQIFRLFYRAPGAAARAPGAGIGLYVSRALVEAMGGRIWVTGREGRGTEVGFLLPIYRDPDAVRHEPTPANPMPLQNRRQSVGPGS